MTNLSGLPATAVSATLCVGRGFVFPLYNLKGVQK